MAGLVPLLVVFACAVGIVLSQSPPTVVTPYGEVMGVADDQGVFAFRGIPFAAPPVGLRRFADPVAPAPWNGTVLNATVFAPGCIQQCNFPQPQLMCPAVTSEDCLYLNVFTPTTNATANLPVVVFIHGGNFDAGAGGVPFYDGGDLARRQDLVVVTINYRLGVLGALYTGTVKGNFHLKDQRQSLKFISEVIASFGGNPNQVIISGQSAGAFSVAAHLSSPESWPYFNGAILMSDPFSLIAETPERAITLGEKFLGELNCSSQAGQEELACLRNATAEQILWQQANGRLYFDPIDQGFFSAAMPWVPVVDGVQMPYHPLQALTENHFHQVPVMMGTVANESVGFVWELVTGNMSGIEAVAIAAAAFGIDEIGPIFETYGLPPSDKDAHAYVERMATDYLFYCPTRKVAASISAYVPTFVWFFDMLPSSLSWVYNSTTAQCATHICHATDLPFIFNPFRAPMPPAVHPPTPTAAELQLTHLMQTAWGNFARNSNPNPLPQGHFPAFNATTNSMVNYSVPQVSVIADYRAPMCDFWDKYGYLHY